MIAGAVSYLEVVEKTLDEVLPAADCPPAVLHEAMRYAVGSGGKRLRPLICLAAATAVGGEWKDAIYPACAIELLHNYTLIHDDLPAMDNDRERRGRPTVWVKFGEANAILAGDALLALAYQVASKAPRNVPSIIGVLGEKGVGVVQGQVEDLKRGVDMVDIDFIYRHKTADLFIASAVMGGLAAGGVESDIVALRDFATNLGMAFQYEDDLLDGDSPYSCEHTESLVTDFTKVAIDALSRLPGDVTFLRDLAQKLVGRQM